MIDDEDWILAGDEGARDKGEPYGRDDESAKPENCGNCGWGSWDYVKHGADGYTIARYKCHNPSIVAGISREWWCVEWKPRRKPRP